MFQPCLTLECSVTYHCVEFRGRRENRRAHGSWFHIQVDGHRCNKVRCACHVEPNGIALPCIDLFMHVRSTICHMRLMPPQNTIHSVCTRHDLLNLFLFMSHDILNLFMFMRHDDHASRPSQLVFVHASRHSQLFLFTRHDLLNLFAGITYFPGNSAHSLI